MSALPVENTNYLKLVDDIFKNDTGNLNYLLDKYNQKILNKENLSSAEAREAMKTIMADNVSDYQKGQFLAGLKIKGYTCEEIASFAEALREMATPVQVKIDNARSTVLGDTCGTGGGTVETFNISTAIMFILAAAGMIIAKHGNKAITSKCGSADVLEALGVQISIPPEMVSECISKIGLGFIYAPNFHKAFKNVQNVRRQLPFPTVFNLLGPLANPAFKTNASQCIHVQILGVNNPELTEMFAHTLKLLKVNRAIVAYGLSADNQGMDELSTLGKTKISELNSDHPISNYYITPEDFRIKRADIKDLKGGNPQENAKIIRDILSGKETGPKLDIVLLNAAAGLYVGGIAKSINEGISLAKSIIKDGGALGKLNELVKFTH